MTQNPGGMWLPYGTDDSSVIFRHPLTTAFASNPSTGLPSGAIVPYTTRTIEGNAAGPYYDPVLGLRGSIDGDTTTGSAVRLSGGITAAQLTALDRGGQITCEISRDWLCENGTTAIGSEGYNPSGNEGAFHGRSVASSSGEVLIYKPTTSGMFTTQKGSSNAVNEAFLSGIRDLSCSQSYLHTYGKDEMVRVNLGWTGSAVGTIQYLAIDGVLINSDVITVQLLSAFERVAFGAWAGTYFAKTGYIRNFQLSSKVPTISVNSKLRNVTIMSDSIVSSTKFYSSSYRDLAPEVIIRRVLEKANVMMGKLTIFTNSGYSVTSGGSEFLAAGAALTARNTQAEVIVMYAGTNDRTTVDAGTTNEATFKADYQTLIEYFLGSKCTEGAYNTDVTGCKMVVCNTTGTCVSPTYNEQTALDTISQWIREIVSDWDTNYPSAAGRVVLADVRARTGGGTEPATWPEGATWFADGLHMAWPGYYWLGTTIGETLRDKVLASSVL